MILFARIAILDPALWIILSNITIDANPSPRSGLPATVSKMVTKMVRHCDQDEREEDGSYHWETVKSLLLIEFAQERGK